MLRLTIKQPHIAFFLLFSFGIIAFQACNPATTEKAHAQDLDAYEEEQNANSLPENAQLLIVRTADWDAVSGQLHRFEYREDHWEEVSDPYEIVVGKNGMGWGIGIEDFRDNEGPQKKEGDLKSPAGIFDLGNAFGYQLAEDSMVSKLSWPYTPVLETTMCIEDGQSRAYNQIVDEDSVKNDWNSTDHMLRDDELYKWGAFVQHNPEAETNLGSCIFLHVWREAGSGTAGCTAMKIDQMLELLQWLDPEKNPQLVQLPSSAYPTFQKVYALPNIL